jgi:hypothetical protein
VVSDVAGEFRGEVEFVVDNVFHVDAGGAGVLKENRQGRLKFVSLVSGDPLVGNEIVYP